MTRQEKKEELIGLFVVGAIYIGDLIDECIEYGQQHPHWISVEEELPKEHGAYLVFNSVTSTEEIYVYSNGEWWYNANRCPTGVVTHWMPLPPPVVSKSENIGKKGGEQIIGTADHIKIALDVLDKKGGEE